MAKVHFALAACLFLVFISGGRGEEPAPKDVHGAVLPAGALARLGTVRWRHGAAVTFVAHTPDGTGLITDCQDGTLRLWDLATGTEVRRFSKEVKPTAMENGLGLLFFLRSSGNGAALSPDGRLLAAGATDGSITLWHVATGRVARTLRAEENRPVSALRFSADGELLIAKDNQGVLLVWDLARGVVLRQLGRQPNEVIRSFGAGELTGMPMVLPGGDAIASVTIDLNDTEFITEVKRWDLVTGRELGAVRLEVGGNDFLTFAFSPDGKLLANAGFDGTVRLIDLATGKERRQLDGLKMNSLAAQLTFAPDSQTLAAWSSDHTIRLWDVATGKELRRIGEPSGPRLMGIIYFGGIAASNLAFSADGKYLTVGTSGSTVRRWEVASGKEVGPADGHTAAVVALGVDGTSVITRGVDRLHRVWDIETGREVRQHALPGDVTVATFASDGRTAALAAPDGTLRLWDVQGGKEIRRWQGNAGGFADLAFAADGKALAARGFDKVVRFYDLATGQEQRTISLAVQGEPADVSRPTRAYLGSHVPNMLFSTDGTVLATMPPEESLMRRLEGGSRPRPGALRLLDVATGKPLAKFDEQKSSITAFAYAPDGRTLATAQGDGSLILWEALTGKVRLQPHRATTGTKFSALAYAADSRVLAGGGPGGMIHLWDTVTGRELGKLQGHQGSVQSLRFTADGRRLISGSADTSALVWDVERLVKEAQVSAITLKDGELEELWHALSGGDPARAHPAAVKLIANSRQAVPLLRERLRPVPATDAERMARLLGDLDAKEFATRQRAAADLEKLGELIEPALKEALAAQPSLERRQRLEQLQERLVAAAATPTAERLQTCRAAEVLERIGTEEAREILKVLAGGAAGARLTREAKGAVGRMGR